MAMTTTAFTTMKMNLLEGRITSMALRVSGVSPKPGYSR